MSTNEIRPLNSNFDFFRLGPHLNVCHPWSTTTFRASARSRPSCRCGSNYGNGGDFIDEQDLAWRDRVAGGVDGGRDGRCGSCASRDPKPAGLPRIRAYDGRVRGELEYAVSESRSSPSTHRISVIMSPAGRFLQCSDCQLSYTFPEGAEYRMIAKNFESHRCFPSSRRSGWQTDSRFIILRYEDNIPAMASCVKCEEKFFAPATFAGNPVAAKVYLGQRFDVHACTDTRERQR